MMSDLPANVRPVFDRHGKVRYRFRRKGWASAYVKGEPGTAEFHRSLAEIIERGGAEKPAVRSPRKATPRSLDDLFARMKTGTRWQKKADSTRLVQGRIIERFLDRTSSNLFGVIPRLGISRPTSLLRAGEVG